jgi:hypothetical protein
VKALGIWYPLHNPNLRMHDIISCIVTSIRRSFSHSLTDPLLELSVDKGLHFCSSNLTFMRSKNSSISSCFARYKGLLRQEFLPAFLNCFLCMSQSEFSDMVTLHMSIWKSKRNNSIHNNVSRAWFHFMFKHKKEWYSTEMHRSTWLAPTPPTSCLIRGTDNQHTYKFVRKCWHARKCTIGRDQEP